MSATVDIAISAEVDVVNKKLFARGTGKTTRMETHAGTQPAGEHGEHSILHCKFTSVTFLKEEKTGWY